MPERQLNKSRETISSMFDSIAPVYDRLNHLLSFGIDRSWRRRLVRAVSSFCALRGGEVKVLDMACGTGDVSIALRRKGLDVVGADISENMLALARKKAPGIDFRYGDASELPFADRSFDAVTIAFGIRNFDKRAQCIRELHRVLKDGGMLAIAEFSIPRNRLWRGIYTLYFKNILPAVGRLVSKQAYAYSYLPESSFDFPAPEKFRAELSEGGFRAVTARSMTGGVSYLYIGRK
jgi:demethylmenaquinone methyltransferase/2-methoxy-6-polyprenyl-1,4-benzoquinol methylase